MTELFAHAKFVGLTGAKGSGKDTVASYLVGKFSFRKMAFAAPIKNALVAMFETGPEIFEDTSKKDEVSDALLGYSPRYLMQTLGTEWGRDVLGDTFWVDLLMPRAKKLLADGHSVVVSDVRFDSEAIAIKEQGGFIVHVSREYRPYDQDSHRSESGINTSLIDYRLYNNTDLRTLYTQLGVTIGDIDRHLARRNHAQTI